MSDPDLRTVFSKNRAEELGYDVWGQFVVPPFYDEVKLGTTQKPSLIVGGRGCGKTMLLRYLSHHTAFSPKRQQIPPSALLNIGLYWKADTQFATSMVGRGIHDDVWSSAFSHMAALMISLELITSLEKIAHSAHGGVSPQNLSSLDLSPMAAFDSTLPSSLESLSQTLQLRLWAFEAWVNNARKSPEPYFYPGPSFVLALLKTIQTQLPALQATSFFVYLDEYENLCNYQQRIVNTWVKHSAIPLIFNLAMKRNGMETRETTGTESLSNIHDFREHDLEQYIIDGSDFKVFAAEILFLLLSQAGIGKIPVNLETLRDPQYIQWRRDPDYRKQILARAADLFPDRTWEELALAVLRDSSLRGLLMKRIQQTLVKRGSKLTADQFLCDDVAKAAVVIPPLLHRANLRPEDILDELQLHRAGQSDRFDDWIHNNFVGAFLQLYVAGSRPCPFYAGFNTFCLLSHGNIRHFLELCHKSIHRALDREEPTEQITPALQAEAAKQASAAFLGEVKSCGRFGNQLHAFVLRLGTLFQLAHSKAALSEPEQNHFAVTEGLLTEDDHHVLREAVKWSVLFEEVATKKKQDYQPAGSDYVLAPIYSPFFHISYRKKRKIELTATEFHILYFGTTEAVEGLLRDFKKRWRIDDDSELPPLFSVLLSANPQ